MNYFNKLKKKINSKKAIISVIGLGYVGEALIKKFSKEGFSTIGIDYDKNKLRKFSKKSDMVLSDDYKFLERADVIIIAVPTPLTKKLTPDLSFIKSVIKKSDRFLKKGQLISLESTTYPGTTEELFRSFLINKKFNLSEDFFLVYSPERISPELKIKDRTLKYDLHNTPKIYSGYSLNCKLLGKILYKNISKKVVLASSLKMAETSKMIENIFRSINIGLVNELKMFLHKIDIDINEALDLAETKPFGFTRFDPGPGYGGHCIPIDPFYLYWLAKRNKFNLKLIKASGLINEKLAHWVCNQVIKFIKKKKIKLPSKKILILGVAYKANIDDIRESPALRIAKILKKKGYNFDYSDPYVDKIIFKSKVFKSKKLTSDLFKKYPIVLILTDHKKFNYRLVSKRAKYIFDTRNTLKSRVKNYFKI